MHNQAAKFVAKVIEDHGPFKSVIEIGSRDINGSVKPLFGKAEYTGLDLMKGKRVDWVGDARDFAPKKKVDCVVCCEVMEHARFWGNLIEVAKGWLKSGGYLIVTCAGPGRHPHSAIDGKFSLREGEYYENVHPRALCEAFMESGLEVLISKQLGEDTQGLARLQ